MDTKKDYSQLASDIVIEKTIKALIKNNINAIVVNSGSEAKASTLQYVKSGSEVMNMSSQTLDSIGLTQEFTTSRHYLSVKNALMGMDDNTQGIAKRRLGSAQEWAVGSVHAITEDGVICVASNTGSQLPAYAYGAQNVLLIVGTQKIVKDLDAAFDRIYNYCFPLENTRLQRLYNIPSGVNKVLIINKEVVPGRISVMFVKEKLGF